MSEKKLTPYQGRDVIASSIAIPNISGGLNQALAVDHLELPIGFEGVLAVQFRVKGHQHKGVKDTEALELVNVLHVTNGTLIDGGVVEEALAEQKRRADEAAGRMHLLYDDEDPADDDPDPDVEGDPAEPAPV